MIFYPDKLKEDDILNEINGLYGPINVSEKFIQRIWFERKFLVDKLYTLSGKRVVVLEHGVWNMNEGPDFKNALIQIDGKRLHGDIEVHFKATDWLQHRHHEDKGFSNVVLHVVLFKELADSLKIKAKGTEIEVLVLLDQLKDDIESIAMEQALLSLTNKDTMSWVDEFFREDPNVRERIILEKARKRWDAKCKYAKLRIDKYGWDEACHQLCLEVLGYSRNRKVMGDLAVRYPLEVFQKKELSVEDYMEFGRGKWKLKGIRPANNPKKRLEQYGELMKINKNWTQTLYETFDAVDLPLESYADTSEFRKRYKLSGLRFYIKKELFGNVFGMGTKLDTLLIDGFFPLISIFTGKDYFSYWYHWYSGDFPEKMKSLLIKVNLESSSNPIMSNGINQATFQLYIDRSNNPVIS